MAFVNALVGEALAFDALQAFFGAFKVAEPTKPMIAEAASAGLYETEHGKFPRLQILTIADLFEGKRPKIPFGHAEGFKKAPKEKTEAQGKLL